MKTIVDRIDAVNQCALRYFRKKLRSSSRAQDYLYSRIRPETARKFGVGYAPKSGLISYLNKQDLDDRDVILSGLVHMDQDQTGSEVFSNRVMFPIVHAGKLLGFGGRTLSTKRGVSKYINTRKTPVYSKRDILYGLHNARRGIDRLGYAVLVEGYFDVIVPWEAGVINIVAPCGTAFTPQQVQLLARYTEDVYTFFDGDAAGRKSATQAAVILDEADMYAGNIRLPAGLDPAEFIAKYGRKGLKALRVT